MPDVGGFLDQVASYALTWLPLVFFGLITTARRTLEYMPRVKPAKLEASASSSVSWVTSPASRRRRPSCRRSSTSSATRALPSPRRARAEGDPALRPAGHREDAAGEGGGEGVRRAVLLAERLCLRGDVRRPRGLPDPQAVRDRSFERAGDRLHRRARRRRHGPLGRWFPPRARSDPESAARGAPRLRRGGTGDRDGRLEPAPGLRPRAPPAGPLRPAGARLAAGSDRPRADPARPHTRQAAPPTTSISR